MAWFRIDDTFAMHDKVIAAGNAAIGLWARAGAWSMQQLTDGFVPDHVLRALGTPKERRSLVENFLWVEVEGGVEFLNWKDRQPTAESIKAARQAAAERQRHARERAKSQRESRRDKGVSHGPPDPTRPDPLTTTDVVVGVASAANTKRATQRPADFHPTPGHIALAEQLGVDLRAEWQQFCDHHDAKGSTYKDWNAALRTWIRNAQKFGTRTNRPARQQADADMFERMAARAAEAETRGEIA